MNSTALDRLRDELLSSGLTKFGATFAIEFLKKELIKDNGPYRMQRVVRYLLHTVNHSVPNSSMFSPMQLGCPGLLEGLTAKPFWDTRESYFSSWVHEFETHVDIIRQEFESLQSKSSHSFQPYKSPSNDITQSGSKEAVSKGNWNVCYLYLHDMDFEDNRSHFPETIRLLNTIPRGHYNHCLFSALAPDTHITPHHGPTNRKLRCQLPIIVPEDIGKETEAKSRLRVGSECRSLETGKMIIFDDSFEHEACNLSSQPRVVLIFDIWHPDLSDEEVKLLAYLSRYEMRALKKTHHSLREGDETINSFFSVIESGKSKTANDAVEPSQIWG